MKNAKRGGHSTLVREAPSGASDFVLTRGRFEWILLYDVTGPHLKYWTSEKLGVETSKSITVVVGEGHSLTRNRDDSWAVEVRPGAVNVGCVSLPPHLARRIVEASDRMVRTPRGRRRREDLRYAGYYVREDGSVVSLTRGTIARVKKLMS